MIRVARCASVIVTLVVGPVALLAGAAFAQQVAPQSNVVAKLAELVATPAVSGYEQQLGAKIGKELAAFHPITDNIGDVIVTIGSGAPHRLIVAPIDEPGFVVSAITPDGYLRVQRLPQRGLPPIYNMMVSAQPVKVGTTHGAAIDGVFAGLSIHLQPYGGDTHAPTADPADLDAMYVDVGAMSAAEARKAGIDVLNPITLTRYLAAMNGEFLNATSVGDRFGAAAVLDSLAHVDPSKITGTLTVAFVVQQRTGARGLQRILTTTQADELLYVGRLTPGGPIPSMEGVHHAARREPGSGVLVANEQSAPTPSAFETELQKLAAANHGELAADYSSGLMPRSYLPLPALPAKTAHIGIGAAWPDTPAEFVSAADLQLLSNFVQSYETGAPVTTPATSDVAAAIASVTPPAPTVEKLPASGAPSTVAILSDLVQAYGASTHEDPVRERVQALLPKWAKPETDDAGNLVLPLSSGNAKAPTIVVVAHMDEIGYKVKTIAEDGRLAVVELGGGIPYFFQGHPALVHTANGDVNAVVELPHSWDNSNFKWPDENPELTLRIDPGARTAEAAAKLGIKVGDTITIPKAYRRLIGTRANGRSFDDRVGCTALIAAVWALGGPSAPALKGRNVTFVWSTGEEEGLVGAGKYAARMAEKHEAPDFVFAVDTFVSSDSPLESKRYADAEIGKGFVVRAVDSSNIVTPAALEKMQKLARENQIPIQYGVTSGGNDGSAFVRYGTLDVALGWPLRYSHSPAEVVDTRDVEALARIIAAVARVW
jgi:putative aminopeptidase FrvX